MASYQVNPLEILDTTNSTGVGSGGSLTVGGGVSIGQDTYIGGNISVSGTSASFSDNIIVLNSGATTSQDTGLLLERASTDVSAGNNYSALVYSETADEFRFGYATSDTRGTITLNSYVPIRTGGIYAGDSQIDNISVGNLNFNTLYQNGVPYIGSSQWTTTSGNTLSYTSGNVTLGESLLANNNTNTLGNIFTTGGNVGINTTSPSQTLDVTGTIQATTSVTTGALYSTNVTSTNIVGTNVTSTNIVGTNLSSGTLNLSTGITTTSAQITNLNASMSTIGTFVASSGTVGGHLVPSTNITYDLGSSSLRWRDIYLSGNTIYLGDKTLSVVNDTFNIANVAATTANLITSSIGTLLNTNAVSTNISSGTLNLSTGLTSASAQVTNLNVTTGTIPTLLNTNSVSTNISTGTLNLSTGLTSASAQVTNLNVTTGTIPTLLNTNSVSTNISTGTLNSDIVRVTTNISAIGDSNTLGNIFTTGGNVGIGTKLPSSMLDVQGNYNLGGATTKIYSNIISLSIENASDKVHVVIGGIGMAFNIIVYAYRTSATQESADSEEFFVNWSGNTIQTPIITRYRNFSSTNSGIRTAINTWYYDSTNKILTLQTARGSTISQTFGYMIQGRIPSYTSSIQTTTPAGTILNYTGLNQVNDLVGVGMIPVEKLDVSGTLRITSGGLLATFNSNTVGSLFTTGGNVGIGTTTPTFTLDVVGSGDFSTFVTTGALYSTNQTSSNIVSTNISSGTLNLSSGLTSASVQVTNLNVTTGTIPTLLNTNAVSTNISSGTLNLSTGLTSASAQVTNLNVTTGTIPTLLNTNAVSTNISSGTLNLSTGLTSASIQVTNENVTTSTIGTLRNTNTVTTNISSGTLNLSIGLTSASAQITNLNVTTGTIPALLTTNLVSTNVSTNTLVSSTISSNVISATTMTGSNLSLSGNLNVAGTLTTVNITSTNLVNTNVSGGIVVASTSLSATGNSNTIGNIFTTGGNVGVGNTLPSNTFDVTGTGRITTSLTTGALYSTNQTTTNIVGTNATVTNAIFTNISSGTLNLSTGLTSASAQVTNLNVTTGTIPTLLNTNAVSSNISSGTLNLSTTSATPPLRLRSRAGTGALTGVQFSLADTSVSTDAYVKGSILYQSAGTNARGTMFFCLNSANNSANVSLSDARMTILDSGNVGIGTTAPSAVLHVKASSTTTPSSNGVYIYNETNTVNNHAILAVRTAGAASGNPYVSFDINGVSGWSMGLDNSDSQKFKISNSWDNLSSNTRLTITTAGNIGISTTAPAFTLDVNGTLEASNANGVMLFASSGNVGIGTTTPIASLDFGSGSTSKRIGLAVQSTNFWGFGAANSSIEYQVPSGSEHRFYTGSTTTALGTERMRISTSGNIGIGTTSPAYKLHVIGDIYASGDITAYSDARLKTNIETITNPLDKVDLLRGVYYTHIETQKDSIGLIAQETQQVLPEVVATKGEYLGINYGNIVGLLVEAIKELRQEVKILKSQMN